MAPFWKKPLPGDPPVVRMGLHKRSSGPVAWAAAGMTRKSWRRVRQPGFLGTPHEIPRCSQAFLTVGQSVHRIDDNGLDALVGSALQDGIHSPRSRDCGSRRRSCRPPKVFLSAHVGNQSERAKQKRRPSDENRRLSHSWLPSDSNGTPLPCPRAPTSWKLYQIPIVSSRKTLWDRHGQWHPQARVSIRQEHTRWRRGADSNRRVKVLQTSPLTTWVPRHVTHDRRSGRSGQPELAAGPQIRRGCGQRNRNPLHRSMERETGFEPATPTLARLCSTS